MQKRNNKQQPPAKLMPTLVFLSVMMLFGVLQNAEFEDSEAMVLIPVVLIISVSVGLFIAGAKKAAFKKEESEHSHDRLQSSNTAQLCDEDTYTHWKKQLDDFFEAGIIEKSEYDTLLSRYKSGK